MSTQHVVDSIEALAALFGPVGDASRRKEVDHIAPAYRALIEASPFCVLATAGPDGLDASPRGDAPGFVRVVDAHTLQLPERRGNNRVDSLRNLIADPRMALLFLIPGAGETLRVNGRARISVAPDLLQSFAVQGAPPKCVLDIRVDAVFFQCARAIVRSQLWQTVGQRPAVPTAGEMLAALTDNQLGGATYDRDLPARQRATLY